MDVRVIAPSPGLISASSASDKALCGSREYGSPFARACAGLRPPGKERLKPAALTNDRFLKLEWMRCVQRPSPPGPVNSQGAWYQISYRVGVLASYRPPSCVGRLPPTDPFKRQTSTAGNFPLWTKVERP